VKAYKLLAEDLAKYYDDPYGYVMWCFPWGEGQLKDFLGPRKWQKEFLITLGKEIKKKKFNGKDPVKPIQMAVASGHAIGKSALSAWIIKFLTDTRPFSKGVVTANTSDQLRTKTWSELYKWHSISITRDLFTYSNSKGNMSIKSNADGELWRCDAMTCREENSESFAGLHAATSTPYYLFDESSAVPNKISEVAQGGLIDGEPMFFLFGNPTRNSGFFREVFGKFKHRWITRKIDSRKVEGTNKELMRTWVEDHGEDSDFVRVRVRGEFPKSSICQLISSELVEAAQKKKLHPSQYDFAPVILGVDVAWYGDDKSVIFMRQGLGSKILFSKREIDSVDLAGVVARFEDEYKADAVFIDAGMGNGVVDQLRRLGREPIPVYFGGKSLSPKYCNKRAQMWGDMGEWLKLGPMLPPSADLFDEITAAEYHVNLRGEVQLEKKEEMKRRGLSSPDHADALALTFAEPVKIKDRYQNDVSTVKTDYDVFA
jgi:hypothetical protein